MLEEVRDLGRFQPEGLALEMPCQQERPESAEGDRGRKEHPEGRQLGQQLRADLGLEESHGHHPDDPVVVVEDRHFAPNRHAQRALLGPGPADAAEGRFRVRRHHLTDPLGIGVTEADALLVGDHDERGSGRQSDLLRQRLEAAVRILRADGLAHFWQGGHGIGDRQGPALVGAIELGPDHEEGRQGADDDDQEDDPDLEGEDPRCERQARGRAQRDDSERLAAILGRSVATRRLDHNDQNDRSDRNDPCDRKARRDPVPRRPSPATGSQRNRIMVDHRPDRGDHDDASQREPP